MEATSAPMNPAPMTTTLPALSTAVTAARRCEGVIEGAQREQAVALARDLRYPGADGAAPRSR